MKYQEIYKEYTSLVNHYSNIRFELHDLPKGSIVKKKITNKEYHYLQYTSYGKKKTEYIREPEVESLRAKLLRGEELREKIAFINTDMLRLEKAAKILDYNLSRAFYFMRQCAEMDALPISKRKDAMSFASAMTALEGLSAQKDTEENLSAWAAGEKAFADFYIPALQRYGVLEASYGK